jgi:uncharacterized protein
MASSTGHPGVPPAPSAPQPPSLADATPDAPAPGRIQSIDVLRGFALLGILVMNVQSFAMPEAAYFIPTAYGDFSGANFWVWALSHALADQKMMTIFGMLFGAGMVLMAESRQRAGAPAAGLHYRRMAALLLFGLAHAYLLWYGDILVSYALCGMAVYPLRRLRPAVLLPLGVAVIGVASLVTLFLAFSVRFWPPEEAASFRADALPPPEVIAYELEVYRGGWLQQMDHRAPTSLFFQTVLFAMWGVWRVVGLMLIGMALFKLGVFSARRSKRFYLGLIAVGLLVGLPVVAYGAYRNIAAHWDPIYVYLSGSQFNYWGSLLVSLGWVGAVMLLCMAGPASRAGIVTGPLAAVGRLALTNYLLQTLLCTTLFYGHGLGLFGRVERVGQIAVVAGVWALQLILSPLYLRHFRIGPAEWLWRCLTYLKAPPFRNAASPAPAAAVGGAPIP